MAHRITRTHEFDAGHRVCGHEGKCAHLHGHRYQAAFTCEAANAVGLDHLGRVIDFSVIKSRLCQWLEDNWDHRMLLWYRDPILEAVQQADPSVRAVLFNPTAENIAEYLVTVVGPDQLAGTGVRLASVTIHETAKCSATYSV